MLIKRKGQIKLHLISASHRNERDCLFVLSWAQFVLPQAARLIGGAINKWKTQNIKWVISILGKGISTEKVDGKTWHVELVTKYMFWTRIIEYYTKQGRCVSNVTIPKCEVTWIFDNIFKILGSLSTLFRRIWLQYLNLSAWGVFFVQKGRFICHY